MTSFHKTDSNSFFHDNESFETHETFDIKQAKKTPSEIIAEYNKTGPRKSDPFNTDDSTDADTDYNENDVAVTSRRNPSFIKSSLKSFRKRIKTLPDDVNETFTGKKKFKYFCCFRQNT